MIAAVEGGVKKKNPHKFMALFFILQACHKHCEGLGRTVSVQEVAGNEAAAQQDLRHWESICVKMSLGLYG